MKLKTGNIEGISSSVRRRRITRYKKPSILSAVGTNGSRKDGNFKISA